MFPSFELLGRTVGMYGVMSVLGFCVAVLFFYRRVKKSGVPFEDVIIMALVAAAGVLVGGHLLYGITRISDVFIVLKNASRLGFGQTVRFLADCFGGSVFYGGLFGSLAAGAIYLKRARYSPEVKTLLADTYGCAIPLFHTFGRIGCFLGGCCYGMESGFGFIAHGNTIVPEVNDVRRFPVALIEAGCNLILFFLLWQIARRSKHPGRMILYYGISYPVIRFTLEFFRGDAIRGGMLGLSTSQWISLAFFAFSIIRLILIHERGEERKPLENSV